MSPIQAAQPTTSGGDPRRTGGISGVSAWRWSAVLFLVGAGLALFAGEAEPVPYYTETSARGEPDLEAPTVASAPWVADAAVAGVRASRYSLARGTVRLQPTPDGTRVVMDVEGLPPGRHAVSVHSAGDCSAHDGAGPGPEFPISEVGDATLLEVTVGSDWTAHASAVVPALTLSGERSVVGRALVIRALDAEPGEDHMGCGTVGVA